MNAGADPVVSPLAPAAFPTLPAVGGVQLSTIAAGLRYAARADLMLATLAAGSTVAGTFTRSRCPSAPVDWCKQALAANGGGGRAVVCNAGNANAFTGRAGETAARRTAEGIASVMGIAPTEVYLASTGVIGETLPTDALVAALPALVETLGPADGAAWRSAADAIRTTDTFAKGAGTTLVVGGTGVAIAGFAKGSGMIAPDMATMLAFVFTDLAVDAATLQACLSAAVDQSFNRITVDSDTSTSDTVLLAATGASGVALDPSDPDALAAFGGALERVLVDLAHQIVRDGEGATKFVEVEVTGATDDAAARTIALSIANSPLVKTALAASDANWGRIVMAVGKAGVPADRDRLAIWIGDELTAEQGVVAPGYDEARATEHLSGPEIRLRVDIGLGGGAATVWTCDLTHGYIDINAGYRS